MANQDVRVILRVDDEGAIQKLRELGFTVESLAPKVKGADDALAGLWKQFTFGNLAADALRKAIGGVKQFLESSVTEALESEQAQHRLATALEMTGRAGVRVREDLINFAQEQQKVTLYTDEEIESTITLLAQLTKLDNEGLKQATKGAMGLAAALGIDLSTASIMVEKALQGNFQMLQRYGIKVDETLPKEQQIVEMKRKLLDLYPRATAETETMAGRVAQLSKNWGEFKENFGASLLEMSHAPAIIGALNSAMGWAANRRNEGPEMRAIRTAAEEIDAFRMSLNYVKPSMDDMAEAHERGKKGWEEYCAQIRATDAALAGMKPQAQAMVAWLGGILGPGKAAADIADVLRAKTQGLADAFKKLGEEWEDSLARLMADQLPRLMTLQGLVAEGGGLAELNPGDIVDNIFPTDKEFEMPDFMKEIVDSVGVHMPQATKTIKKEIGVWEHAFDGFYNDVANGFANLFMNFRLSASGFKDFFVGIWEEIKRAFFKVIGEMIAKWLIFKVILGIFNPLGALTKELASLSGAGGILGGGPVLAASGFQGVVEQPTLFLAGENYNRESVDIRPLGPSGRGGGASYNFSFTVQAMDSRDVEAFLRYRAKRVIQDMIDHNELSFA